MTKREKEGAQFLRHFGPILDALRSLGGSGTPSEVVERVARELRISEDAQNEVMESGAPRFPNQVAWARFYLTREGLLDKSKRGVWFLKLLLDLPPAGFERLCQRLLRESGFVQVVVTGRSGDGGIDGHGTLEVNPLVSFKVLFQCKRYVKSVSPSQVRDFRGAMQGRTDKGIILTTGSFTAEARREAARDGVPPIELVDGSKLMEMFEKLELGLKTVTSFEIDDSFFADFANQPAGN